MNTKDYSADHGSVFTTRITIGCRMPFSEQLERRFDLNSNKLHKIHSISRETTLFIKY